MKRAIWIFSTLVMLWIGLLILVAQALVPPQFFEHEPWGHPAFLDTIPWVFLPQLLPCLGLVACAALLGLGLRLWTSTSAGSAARPEEEATLVKRQITRWIAAAVITLGVLVLAGGMFHFYWLLVWDSTYDALNVIWLGAPILAAFFGVSLLALLQPGKRLPLWLGGGALAFFLLIGVFISAKTMDTRALTEFRSARIARALETYHARHGSYPSSLRQLTPWTLLKIPEPVILHGQAWCYQGGQDAYRLGFVDREHWSSPNLYATLAQSAGVQNDVGDLCKDAIATLKEVYPKFYGLGD